MKIHRIYNELNQIEDISKDKVQIEVSAETWILIKKLVINGRFGWNGLNERRLATRIEKVIHEAELEQTTEWTK